ncbi:hypothetical protein [Halegenticoccus tardaugens]|uniref:hypothetical protein n=1 Tax=Halegenticoccus tardaugens TaxID=2071624 RepID=UPI00100B7303|nr:hypothetical protein [Halegenticoccus tardaugens]
MTADTTQKRSMELLREAGGLRRVAFYVTIVTILALMTAFLGDTLAFIFTAWTVSEPGVHHLHDLTLVTILWTVVLGLLVQLYEPERRVAGIQQAVLVNIVITGSNFLTGFIFPPALILGGLLLVAFALHPAGWDVLQVRTAGSVSPVLVGLVVLAGIPFTIYAADQYALQASGDVHAQLDHYADMVTYALLVLLLGLLASAKPVGWRIPLWSAAGLVGVLGATSILHPALASSAGPIWGGLAILWAAGLIVVGEVSHRRSGDNPT